MTYGNILSCLAVTNYTPRVTCFSQANNTEWTSKNQNSRGMKRWTPCQYSPFSIPKGPQALALTLFPSR